MNAEYQQTAEQVIRTLGSDRALGCQSPRRARRLAHFGPNQLATARPGAALEKFLAQFQDVLVILLLVATAISASSVAVRTDAALPYEAIAISAVVLLNAVMGYVQEERAESAIAALRQMAAARRM